MEQVVWVPEPKEGFALATIVDLGMDEVTVLPVGTSKARFTLPLDRVYTADPHFDDKDVDDNCKHNDLYNILWLIIEIFGITNIMVTYRFSDALERSHITK